MFASPVPIQAIRYASVSAGSGSGPIRERRRASTSSRDGAGQQISRYLSSSTGNDARSPRSIVFHATASTPILISVGCVTRRQGSTARKGHSERDRRKTPNLMALRTGQIVLPRVARVHDTARQLVAIPLSQAVVRGRALLHAIHRYILKKVVTTRCRIGRKATQKNIHGGQLLGHKHLP